MVYEDADQGHDKVFSTVDFSLRGHTQHVEDLELLGKQDAFATGNSQHNQIVGNDGNNLINGAWGNDTLIGGLGNDTLRDDIGKDDMIGGEGDDTYYLDNKGDDIRERAGEGRDHVISNINIALEDLSPHLETLTLTGNHGLSGKGNLKDNLILGNSGNNHVEGLQGNDTLHGNQGDDSLRGQAGHDTLYGGSGDDLVQGGAGDDNLTGGLGDDTIFGDDGDDFISAGDGIDEVTGGPGDDTLLGSAGDDTLTGNGDDDVFVMRPGGSDDNITDFNNGSEPSSGDKIDISAFGLPFDQIGFEEQSDGLRVRFGSDSILLQTLDAPALDRSDFVGLIDNIAETGTLTLNHTTQTVKLESSYDNPVVIAHVATENGGQPVNVRVSEVGGDELTLQLQEPNHLNGTHVDETVNYMVVEAGSWVLPDGTLMEAGTMDSDKLSSQGFETVAFDAEFDAAPSVLSQVQSFNGGDFVTTRQRGADADSFQFTMQEEEAKNDGRHVTESLGWIAVEPGSGSAGDFSWRAGSTSGVTDATASVGLDASMADDAHVIAALSSFDGRDTAWARGNGSTDAAFDISVEEDTSRDRETGHIPETVDYFAFDEAGVLGAYDFDFFV
jgi:hypothetical protein